MIPQLRSSNFVLFAISQCANFTGSWAQKTAVGWLAWELTHSPMWVGAIALSDLVAALWVGPLAGAVTDRSNSVWLILLTQSLTLISCLAIWLLVGSGIIAPWLLFLWAVGDSTIQGFSHPIRTIVVGRLAPENRLSQAIATNSIAVNLARTSGPAVAGLLITRMGIESVFIFHALSFLMIFPTMICIRPWIDQSPLAQPGAPLRSDVLAGFRYILNDQRLAVLFVLVISFAMLARPFTELFPALAGSSFDGGPQILATLMSAQGLGAFLGASWMLRRQSNLALLRTSYGAALGISIALTIFAFAESIVFAFPVIALAGLFHVVCNISMQTLAQTFSLPSMRGRVLGLYTLVFRTGPALGAFIIGFLAQWFDLQVVLGLAASLFALLICAVLPVARRTYAGV